MQQNEKNALLSLVTDVLGYYRQPVSVFTLSVWWNACQNFSLEQVSKALTVHATDPDRGQFAPKVADVVRILVGTKTDRSLLAWGRVYDAMCEVGSYRDVDFGDAAIHAAIVDMGGWPKMCRTEMDEISFLQHRFCESYRAYQTSGVTEQPVLIGDHSPADMYVARGLPAPVPVVIGSGKARARFEVVDLLASRQLPSLEAA